MLVKNSRFKANGALKNSHFSTIYPLVKLTKGFTAALDREVIHLEDGDFLEVDYYRAGNQKLLLLAHGLEGSSRQRYMLYMIDYFSKNGYDICSINFRSCSGKMNKTARLYHSGEIQDFSHIIDLLSQQYNHIELSGFSMGGNIILRYLGQMGDKLPAIVKKAAVFSVPIDLGDCSKQLSSGFNKVYTEYFMKSLRKKVDHLNSTFPELKLPHSKSLKNFPQFDSLITAPLFDFKSADDYYYNASSIRSLDKIQIDTLLVNAANDPFLGKKCFPVEQLKNHPKVSLEVPQWGGHVGFFENLKSDRPWFVERAFEFLNK